jgi:acyl-CoA dehydrogenase
MTQIKPDTSKLPFSNYPAWTITKLRPIAIEKIQAVHEWVETRCIPAQGIMKAQLAKDRWNMPPLMRHLREEAKQRGLFNLFLPKEFEESPGLTNLE